MAIISATLYSLYAGNNIELWSEIEGQEVTHKVWGRGVISKIERLPEKPMLDSTIFFKGKNVTLEYFRDGVFSDLAIPEELEESVLAFKERKDREERESKAREEARRLARLRAATKRQQIEAEKAEARNHFEQLKKKYQVAGFDGKDPTSLLYKVLISLEEGDDLSKDDVQWLDKKKLYRILAVHYEMEFRKYNDLWDLIKASSNYQNANDVEKAIELTDGIKSSERRVMSAILTTRGRAFRSLLDLDNAEQCARSAIKLNPNRHYAFNLLGAVYIGKGKPEEAQKCFTKAQELNPNLRDQDIDNDIRSAMSRSGVDEKKCVAEYLLRKDPVRYHWAKRYLS